MDIKEKLCNHLMVLIDEVDRLKMEGASSILISPLERALTIGNMSILYYQDMGEVIDEIELLSELALKVADEQANTVQEDNLTVLSEKLEAIEEYFVSKGYLLDGVKKKIKV